MRQFTAGKNEQDMRLSRFVQRVACQLPASAMYKAFRNRRIKVNGHRAAPDPLLCEGDVIALYLNDEFFEGKKPQPRAQQAKKSRFSMRVIYEDADIAALYKPAHLLCHSDRTGDDSLVGQFVRYLEQRGEYARESENGFAPAVANRLDRGTEGLVLAAKNRPALRALNEIIRQDMLRKEYICITVGRPPQGLHEAYLRHFEKENKVRVQLQAAPGYKKIITQVQVLRTCGPYSLCCIGLITGRTHQIRAHLAFLGTPVLGDIKYGNRKMNARAGLSTQALCAARVTFGQLPEENVLARLSGKCIALPGTEVEKRFETLCAAGR